MEFLGIKNVSLMLMIKEITLPIRPDTQLIGAFIVNLKVTKTFKKIVRDIKTRFTKAELFEDVNVF